MMQNPTLSDATRRALALARTVASEANAACVGTEHLLAGLLSEPSQDARAALRQAGGDVSPLLRSERESATNFKMGTVAELPYSQHAKPAIIVSAAEAHQDGQSVAQPRHLLRALAVDPANFAAQLLACVGVTIDTLRRPPHAS